MKKVIFSFLCVLAFCPFLSAQKFTPQVKAQKFTEIAKPDVKVLSVSINHDTLNVISAADFVFYPFGKYKNIGQFISRSRLEWYHDVNRFIFNDTSDITVHKLSRLDSSSIRFYYSLETQLMEILSGYITDPEIRLFYAIQTGMSKQTFLDWFFSKPSLLLTEEIKYVKFTSGLREISQLYTFENDTLKSITFSRDYNFR